MTATPAAGSEDRELRAPTPAEIRAGLAASFLDRLMGALEVTETELASVVGIPHQTLVRRRSQGVLRGEEGERAATVARVLDRALSYFDGDRGHALEWLKHPNPVLARDTPLATRVHPPAPRTSSI